MKHKESRLVNWWDAYRHYVHDVVLPSPEIGLKNVTFWRNEVFVNILIYLSPLSLLALIPSVFMALMKGVPIVAIVDLISFSLVILIISKQGLSLRVRKIIFLSIIYILSIVLISYVGMAGPSLLYLLSITVISSIIFSSSAGYYSAWANTFICVVFGIIKYLDNLGPVILDASLGDWVAVSSNLILLSFVCAKCLELLLRGLNSSLHENKITEEKLQKANRLYQFLSQINKNIVHTDDQEILFRNSCQIALEIGQFKKAWIGEIDQIYGQPWLIDQHKFPQGDIDFFNLSIGHQDIQQEVFFRGVYYVCNDIQKEQKFEPWKSMAALKGIQSFIILPIKRFSKIIGSFNLYASETDFFDENEIKLLEEATWDISFALGVLQKEFSHKAMEDQQIISQQTIVESEAKLNEAQSIARLGNWELDFSTQTVLFSKEGCRIFGIDSCQNQLPYAEWTRFIHPEDKDKVLNKISVSRAALSNISNPHRIILKNGAVRYIYSESRFVFDSEGIARGLRGIVQDITEGKKIEEEREKMISSIVQHNNNLEQFAFIVSHNLREPVANILGLSQILRQDVFDEDNGYTKKLLVEVAEQLDGTLKDLNNILQVKSEINEYKELVHFPELINGIKSTIHNLERDKSARIDADFGAIDSITSIKSYIHSIFYNLISNSIKYRKAGKISIIEVKTERNAGKISISFKDNGVGIDLRKNGNKIFGLYKRFHHEVEGKGLGLFMVKTQVEALGGNIRVDSQPGEGAEFIVELPL